MNLRYKKIHKIFLLKLTYFTALQNKLHNGAIGAFGVMVLNSSLLSYGHLNWMRLHLSRGLKKISPRFFKVFVRVFFLISVTRKPNLTRMGKGSGPIHSWFTLCKKSSILLEFITHLKGERIFSLFRKVTSKFSTKFLLIRVKPRL